MNQERTSHSYKNNISVQKHETQDASIGEKWEDIERLGTACQTTSKLLDKN